LLNTGEVGDVTSEFIFFFFPLPTCFSSVLDGEGLLLLEVFVLFSLLDVFVPLVAVEVTTLLCFVDVLPAALLLDDAWPGEDCGGGGGGAG
jgi:hypothetical protein